MNTFAGKEGHFRGMSVRIADIHSCGHRNCLFSFHLVFFLMCAEWTAMVASFFAGFDMDGDVRPREFKLQVRFKVVGKIVGLVDRYRPRYNKVELDEGFRA